MRPKNVSSIENCVNCVIWFFWKWFFSPKRDYNSQLNLKRFYFFELRTFSSINIQQLQQVTKANWWMNAISYITVEGRAKFSVFWKKKSFIILHTYIHKYLPNVKQKVKNVLSIKRMKKQKTKQKIK